jgi:hypothetical protein
MKNKIVKFKVKCIREKPNVQDMEINLMYNDKEKRYMPYPEC